MREVTRQCPSHLTFSAPYVEDVLEAGGEVRYQRKYLLFIFGIYAIGELSLPPRSVRLPEILGHARPWVRS